MVNPDALYMDHVAADVSPRTLKIFSADSRRRLRFLVREHGLGAVKAVQADDNHPARRSAFTLIESLVLCAVIGILASLISASVMSAKAKARQVQCLANLHQHGLALNAFLADHHEYPLALSANVREQYPHHHRSWSGALFPEQLDQRDVFQIKNGLIRSNDARANVLISHAISRSTVEPEA